MKTHRLAAVLSTALICSLTTLTTPVTAEGNRYLLDRAYLSDISASEAYRKMQTREAILIDVRRLREHAAGHPGKAFNVPYPHIVNNGDQTAETLYDEVYRIVKGKMDTPIMTLCRTGFRSVLVGNILAAPSEFELPDGSRPLNDGRPAFTNVQNIWEGFVGRYKEPYIAALVDPDPETGPLVLQDYIDDEILDHSFLDLNNNGMLDDDVADVYTTANDANPDKDGWRNYAALPWNTQISTSTAYLRDRRQYDEYKTPVE